MHIFTDNKNRRWEVTLNVMQVKRVRAVLGIDLANVIALDKGGAVKVDLIDRIAGDPVLLVDVLWVLCEQAAKSAGVTDDDFGSALAGDSIEQATTALLDELVDFFPGARRLFLKKAVDLSRKYGAEMTATLEKALADPELESRIRESMSSSPSSPASSE